MDKETKNLIGNPCEVKTAKEARELIKYLGLSRRDKIELLTTKHYKGGPYCVDSKHRHSFMFTWVEPNGYDEHGTREHIIYGMPRSIDRQLITVRYIRCNSQRWFFRVSVGLRTNKILDVAHASNGRPVTVPPKDMFGYLFTDYTDFGTNEGDKCFVTSDGYLFSQKANNMTVTKPMLRELKTYKNLCEYMKLHEL